MNTCRGPQCDKKARAKGLCHTHYEQQRRRGYLIPIGTYYDDPIARFMDLVEETKDCWIWKGNIQPHSGYGRFGNGYKNVLAHRFIYEYWYKVTLRPEDSIDHTCRNRKCVNPEHLECVTAKENVQRAHLFRQLQDRITELEKQLVKVVD